jgi:hypothetical protein
MEHHLGKFTCNVHSHESNVRFQMRPWYHQPGVFLWKGAAGFHFIEMAVDKSIQPRLGEPPVLIFVRHIKQLFPCQRFPYLE